MPKPEKSIKQREMLIAYQNDRDVYLSERVTARQVIQESIANPPDLRRLNTVRPANIVPVRYPRGPGE